MRILLTILSLLFFILNAKSQCDTIYLKNVFMHDTTVSVCENRGLSFSRISINADLNQSDKMVWSFYEYTSPTDSNLLFQETSFSFSNNFPDTLMHYSGNNFKGFVWKDSTCKHIPDTLSWEFSVRPLPQLKTEACKAPYLTEITGETLVDANDTTSKTYVLQSPEIRNYLRLPNTFTPIFQKEIRDANGGNWMQVGQFNQDTTVTLDSIPWDSTELRFMAIEIQCACGTNPTYQPYEAVHLKTILIRKDYSGGIVSTLTGDIRVSKDDSCSVTFPSGKMMLKSTGDFGTKYFWSDEYGTFSETYFGTGSGKVTIADQGYRAQACDPNQKDISFQFSANNNSARAELRLQVEPANILIYSSGWARKQQPQKGFFQYISVRNEGAPISGNLIWSTPNLGSNGYRQIANSNSANAASNSDSQILWTNVSIGFNESKSFLVHSDVLGTAIMGENVNTRIDFFSPQETFTEDHNVLIRNSYDPNDKQVSHKGIKPSELQTQPPLMSYHVRFQNTGNDTAFNILVTDTLSNKLNLETFHLGTASHDYDFEMDGRILKWYFNNIMLPDSGTDYVGSNGHLNFYIEPVKTLQLGDQIGNKANIFFYQNPPIITNTAITQISNTVGIKELNTTSVGIYPNPGNGIVFIDSDEPIEQVDVFDPTGRKLTTVRTKGNSVDVSKLEKGNYILLLHTNRGNTAIKSYIKH
ncbi:T9SS type A sorting domain-containing protein [Luteibaculum oceani]|uniref:T9SS type A sorting domain-containing protein n=1 Tax=Luteibaculum oceani TaxID=1294296 RepID=A0A5C6V4G5_9FLAO|nr:T9SS type A sorting domain-containing protein [Luteibaculum oceani]TXC78638.1 T9SS type A sorting domain-containing protein [Luteibaculum oceani]